MASITGAASARFALPSDRLYMTDRHVWVQMADGTATIGVTAPLGEALAFAPEVEFWAVDRVRVGDTPATADGRDGHVVAVAAPVAGSVVELSEVLLRAPQALLSQPYRRGWVARLAPQHWDRDAARLASAARYREALDRELSVGRDLCLGGALLGPRP